MLSLFFSGKTHPINAVRQFSYYMLKIELIFYLLQQEEKSVKFSVLWSEKNRIWSGKSQGFLFLTGMSL